SLKSAVELFYLDTGKYPSSSQGLSALVARPSDGTGWNGPYLKGDRVPLDPWGHSFVYTLPGAHDAFDIKTLGPDVR
ncbi:MAG: type II secretion system protein GspG, partial [Hyphomicrobiales bacterium]|nr:type II secretion system protein GspG [Hyphomicrobiales bacterium]